MSTPTIQLAFQGGGAKLAAMLPIAHAFAELDAEGVVSIKAVSGSSAGAICAALVAARADFRAVRKYIVDNGAEHFASLVPSSLSSLMAQAQAGKLGWMSLLSHPRLVLDLVLRGQPLLREGELRSFIDGIFAAGCGRNLPQMEELDTKVFITASDIVNAEGFTHTKGDITVAVEDSCSLPVLLRSFKNLRQTPLVDGGLCDNLPVDYLIGDTTSPIFAIFPEIAPERSDISNIVSYFLALINASISHGVSRSKAVISKPFRFPAETDVTLLQFDKAIAELENDDWYEARKAQAIARLRDFARSYGFSIARDEARVLDAIDIEQYRVALESLTRGRSGDFRCLKSQFVIRINSDRRYASLGAASDRVPDTVTRLSRLEVLSEDVRFYRAKVNLSSDGIVPTVWSARNATRNMPLQIRALPMDKAEVGSARNCLLEFIGPPGSLTKGDVIEIQSVYHSQPGSDLARLNVGKPDFLGFANASSMPIEAAELILVYPAALGRISLVHDPQRSTLGTPPLTLDLSAAAPVAVAPGQMAEGLTATNLPPKTRFYALAVPQF